MNMNVAINFLENFIEQRSTASLAEYKQVLGALNDLRKFVAEDPRSAEVPAGKIPYPGKIGNPED